MNRSKKVLIIAGEHSGDRLGRELMDELAKHDCIFFGTGGKQMNQAGMDLWEDIENMSAVGLTEVIKKYFPLKKLIKMIKAQSLSLGIDFAILIDYPGFNLILAKELHSAKIPVFFYVSPQVWAWRYKRVFKIKKYCRHIFVLFPFEAELYKEAGMPVSYFGHPMSERLPVQLASEKKLSLDDKPLEICLMPGSRKRELNDLLPIMLSACLWQFIISGNNNLRVHSLCAISAKAKNSLCRGSAEPAFLPPTSNTLK